GPDRARYPVYPTDQRNQSEERNRDLCVLTRLLRRCGSPAEVQGTRVCISQASYRMAGATVDFVRYAQTAANAVAQATPLRTDLQFRTRAQCTLPYRFGYQAEALADCPSEDAWSV